jgi:hypothetical protein
MDLNVKQIAQYQCRVLRSGILNVDAGLFPDYAPLPGFMLCNSIQD